MNPVSIIDQFILEILTLKGPTLMFAFLIVLGYGLKSVPMFPNKYIPRVVLVFGIGLSPILLAWPDTGQQDYRLRWPAMAAWVSVFLTGFLLAAGSWLFHNKVLKPYIDDRVGAEHSSRSVKELTLTPDGAKRLETTVTTEIPKPKED